MQSQEGTNALSVGRLTYRDCIQHYTASLIKHGRFPLSFTQRVDADKIDKDTNSFVFESGVFSSHGCPKRCSSHRTEIPSAKPIQKVDVWEVGHGA